MTWFLDTNTCIAFLRGQEPHVRDRLLAHSPVDVKIPAIVEAELLYGALRSLRTVQNEIHVRRFLEPFESIPFDSRAAMAYAQLRRDLEKAGTPIGPNDMIIAAVVLVHGGILVTHNQSEFQRVPGLSMEDWRS